jgi:glycosyltransferase involved in cell wall biosynthesis
MRIVVATDYYPPFIGGAQIQSRLLARNLRDRGHHVIVVTVAQRGLPAVELDDGIAVYRLRHLRTTFRSRRQGIQSHHPPFPDPVTVVGLRRLVRKFAPDVVDSYGWISYSCAAALVGTRIPMLLTARDYGYGCANRTLLRDGRACEGPALFKCVGCAGRNYGRPKGWIAALSVLGLRGFLRRRTRALCCISTYVREMVQRDLLGDAAATIPSYVIHDVISTELEVHPRPDRDELACLAQLPREPFILFVGAMRQAKGVDELLAAYQLLDAPPPLVLIGTLEPDSPAAFPPGVRVITDAPHAAAVEAWGRSLFGVMPSILPEPLGTVVMEAMSRGKAVIGTAPGGHSDMIVDGETGLVVPRGDVEALAEAMRILIADPDLRERLGQAAARRSAEFTANVSIPLLEEVLDALASVG